MKILISPKYGAGWSTWFTGNRKQKKAVLTWEPLIAAVERGERVNDEHEAFKSLVEHLKSTGHDGYVYPGGLRDIKVEDVMGRFRIHEYDGSESVRVLESDDDDTYTAE